MLGVPLNVIIHVTTNGSIISCVYNQLEVTPATRSVYMSKRANPGNKGFKAVIISHLEILARMIVSLFVL